MNWIDEVRQKIKRKNQILFSKDSVYLQDFIRLLESMNHRVTILWAFDFAAESVRRFEERYPKERRPREAAAAAREWAAGKIKMRPAQRKILDCHAAAKDLFDREGAAICHSIGQACAVVHTAGHAIGYPIYDLTALIYHYGIDNCVSVVEDRKQEYIDRLLYWENRLQDCKGEWAEFLLR